MPSTPKRRSWLITLPLIVFVLAAAVWGGVWLYVKGEVERAFDAWLAAEAAQGRPHQCPQRGVGGFPFRIDISCAQPVVLLDTPTGPLEARLGGLTATALVYRPDHVLADLRAPLTLVQGGSELGAVDFLRGQASLRNAAGILERFSLVLDQPRVSRGGRPDAAAEQIEVHTRQVPGTTRQARDFDVALSARSLAAAGQRPEQGATVALTGVARNLPTGADARSGLIAQWARGGGTVELQGLRLTRGTGVLAASGSLGFTPAGRAQGEFRATMAESSAIFSGIGVPGFGDLGMVVGPMLGLVGRPADIEGRRGTEVLVKVEDGLLSIGAVQVASFPPVF